MVKWIYQLQSTCRDQSNLCYLRKASNLHPMIRDGVYMLKSVFSPELMNSQVLLYLGTQEAESF